MRALKLDAAIFHAEQPLGTHSEWYRLTSLVTYYQEYVVAAQAQQCWDHSAIVQQYQAGQVTRARYGFEEVGISFRTWLGACEDSEHPWPKASSRQEHMASLAMRQTFIHALDVEGYRELLGLSSKRERTDVSDDKLLVGMHEQRAASAYLPTSAREESRLWLKVHKHSKD